ncbi:MAG: hypothetical protein JO261_15930 [Alphaproteobacteria bacterium]|nr:hypothetical protein [Alphaproteobacteria bacterium]MBV9695183.1 hypothetical protein [Alphaproteobacteria bacterium]
MTLQTPARTLAAVSLVLLGSGLHAPAQTIPSDAQQTCTVSPSTFAGWFASGTPSVNGVVNPANSIAFQPSSNCAFFTWSEQMFLWLTSPTTAQYGGTGHIFDSNAFYQVVPGPNGTLRFLQNPSLTKLNFALRAEKPGPNGLPIIFDKNNVRHEIVPTKLSAAGKPMLGGVEIAKASFDRSGRLLLLNKAGKPFKPNLSMLAAPNGQPSRVMKLIVNKKAVFVDANGNPIIPDQGQAGGGGVLISQSGSLVYYATFVNDVFAYFLTQIKNSNGGNTPPGQQFPTTQQQLDSIVAYAAAHGVKFPDPDALAIETKTSWVDAATLPNASQYVTVNAIVPTYNTSNPNKWTPNGTKSATLALVGIHVVGSATNHPEMIWSTFEHLGNAPNSAYSYVNLQGQIVNVPQDTSGAWLFCRMNCSAPFNDELAEYSAPNIVSPTGVTQPIGPSNTIRWHAWGAAYNTSPNADATSPQSNSLVISINNSVMGQIPNGDIRKNYLFTGSTWTNSGVEPNNPFYGNPNPVPAPSFPPGNEIGTSQISNASMETYQQGTSDNTFGQYGNCFQCHNTTTATPPTTPSVQISHIWSSLQPLMVQ